MGLIRRLILTDFLRHVIDHIAEYRKGNAAVQRHALVRIDPHADHDHQAERTAYDRNQGEHRTLVFELIKAVTAR